MIQCICVIMNNNIKLVNVGVKIIKFIRLFDIFFVILQKITANVFCEKEVERLLILLTYFNIASCNFFSILTYKRIQINKKITVIIITNNKNLRRNAYKIESYTIITLNQIHHGIHRYERPRTHQPLR